MSDPSDLEGASGIPASEASAEPEAAPPETDAGPSDDSRDGASAASLTQEADPSAGETVDLDESDLGLVVEALLFATTSPLSVQRIVDCLERRHDEATVQRALEDLKGRYDTERHAFAIEEIAGGYQVFTRPDYYPWVRKMLKSKKEIKLSRAALETLAIVAYKQPIIRSEVEDIRGVAVGPILRNLMDMNLIKVVGRSDHLGRPMLYGTTTFFLEHFGLKDLKDLPDVHQLEPPD